MNLLKSPQFRRRLRRFFFLLGLAFFVYLVIKLKPAVLLEYLRTVEFMNRMAPRMVNRVKLYTRDEPILDAYGVQEEIDKALKPRVWLRSGGYLVINQTEALVAIDVNTGKFVGKGNAKPGNAFGLKDTCYGNDVMPIGISLYHCAHRCGAGLFFNDAKIPPKCICIDRCHGTAH